MKRVSGHYGFKGIRTKFRSVFKPGVKYQSDLRQRGGRIVMLITMDFRDEQFRADILKQLWQSFSGLFEGYPIWVRWNNPFRDDHRAVDQVCM